MKESHAEGVGDGVEGRARGGDAESWWEGNGSVRGEGLE